MAAARRKKPGKKSQGTPAWMWLMSGVLIGLGLAYYLWSKGFIPQPQVDAVVTEESVPVDAEEVAPATGEPKKSRYDFFTVLPEMEVVVPEQELSRKAKTPEPPSSTTATDSKDSYILQVGSFRSSTDAEQMKARLALLGSVARVQTVTVDNQTWHRVRIGPFKGARKADEMRRMLSDNQIDTLVMKATP